MGTRVLLASRIGRTISHCLSRLPCQAPQSYFGFPESTYDDFQKLAFGAVVPLREMTPRGVTNRQHAVSRSPHLGSPSDHQPAYITLQ